jgi:hypothetical protein
MVASSYKRGKICKYYNTIFCQTVLFILLFWTVFNYTTDIIIHTIIEGLSDALFRCFLHTLTPIVFTFGRFISNCPFAISSLFLHCLQYNNNKTAVASNKSQCQIMLNFYILIFEFTLKNNSKKNSKL